MRPLHHPHARQAVRYGGRRFTMISCFRSARALIDARFRPLRGGFFYPHALLIASTLSNVCISVLCPLSTLICTR